MKLDLGAVLEGLGKLQEVLVSTAEVAGTVYEGFCSLMESGRGVFDSLKQGYGRGKKRPWYAAIRAAHALARAGQLQDLNRLICEAPCRRDPLFQWGICQLLGEIAMDDNWDGPVRQQAVELFGDLFQNDPSWGEDESVKTWMLNIIDQLGAVNDAAVSNSAIALVNERQHDQPASSKLPYPLRNRLPLPSSSPTLVKVHKIPPLEYDLHRLRMLRLEQSHQGVYIPPMAKPSLKAKDEDIFLLMEKTQEFLASGKQVMLVLGDSGAGKSTFNRHLEHRLWTEYKPGDPIPLFINLPAIDRPDKDMIAKQFKVHSFSEDQIMEIKLHRQLILICDGYDESQQLVNLHETNLLNQPGQWNTKMIISCRTQFLGPEYHSRFMPEGEGGHYDRPAPHLFQEAVIAPFSKAQIKDYVEQYVPLEPRTWGTKDYMDRLTTIPNLLDLVRNPFLLSLALEALPDVTEGKQDLSAIKVSRAHLYDTFINHWLDVNKRRLERNSALSMDDRDMLSQLVSAGFISLGLDYSTKLAREIFERQDGKPVVKYVHLSDKNTWKAEFFGSQPGIRLLRESSPLTRAGNQFRFVHRSMLEYFLSRAIYNPAKTDNEDDEEDDAEPDECPNPSLFDVDGPLFRRNLLLEPSIVQFLCDRVKESSDFEQQLRAVIDLSKTDASAAIAATNAITILVRSGVSFNGTDLRGVKIPGADLSGGQFDFAQLQGADLTGADLSRSWLRQVDLSGAQLKDVQFGELPYLEMESEVMSCAYSPDGTMLVAGSEKDGLDVYSTTTWARILQIRDTGGDLSVVFSPGSQQIAFGDYNGTVRVWDISSGEELLAMKGHTKRIFSVVYSPCGKLIASASGDKTVRLWSSQTGENLLVLKGHKSYAASVMFSPDGRQLVSCSGDETIRFWDPETGEPGRVLRSSLGEVYSLAYSPDGKWIASGHKGGLLQLWDAVSSEPGHVLQGHTKVVPGVAFSSSGQWIASASWDTTVKLWDASTGALILNLRGHNASVLDVAFSPNGIQIASGGKDMKVRLWDLSSSRLSTGLQGHRVDSVLKTAYSPDGLSILTAGKRRVQQWDSKTGRSLPMTFQFPGAFSVTDVEFLPDGNQIAAVLGNDNVQVWDRRTCAAGSVFKVERYPFTRVVYSHCSRWVAAFNCTKTIWLWDLHNTAVKEPHVLIEFETDVRFERRSVTFSSAGHQLAIGFADGSIRVFDPQSGDRLPSLQLAREAVGALSYSPNNQQLAIGGSDNSIYLWDGQSQEPGIKLDGHSASVQSIAYSPCAQWIASGSQDKTVRLWHRHQGGEADIWLCAGVVRAFFSTVLDIAWNPITPMEFVTRCLDHSVQVWRMSIDGEGVVVKMLWGFNIGNLYAESLISKDVTDLSPMNQKLLIQRGAVDSSLVYEGKDRTFRAC
ncbi:WD40 repeat-like protein, partial [Linnemannia elongata AG-77]